MGPIKRRLGEMAEREDWRRRRGRFAGLDPDRPDRPQVMPVPEIPAERQTHTGPLGEIAERLAGDDDAT